MMDSPFRPDPAQLEEALSRLRREVEEGLRHGFFDYALSGETIKGGKRRFLIRAGKNYQFVIGDEAKEP